MRIQELNGEGLRVGVKFESEFRKKDGIGTNIAGMIRGLCDSIEGHDSISGQTNDEFLNGKEVVFRFEQKERADRFWKILFESFSARILEHISIRPF